MGEGDCVRHKAMSNNAKRSKIPGIVVSFKTEEMYPDFGSR